MSYIYSKFPDEIDLINEDYKENITDTDKQNIDADKEFLVGDNKKINASFINRLIDAVRKTQEVVLNHKVQNDDDIKNIYENNNKLNDELVILNSVNGLTWTQGYITTQGIVVDNPVRSVTGFILCGSKNNITYSAETDNPIVSAITFYDKNKNMISVNSNVGSCNNEYTVTSPDNAVYLRLSAHNNMLDKAFIKFNQAPIISLVDEIEEIENQLSLKLGVGLSVTSDNYSKLGINSLFDFSSNSINKLTNITSTMITDLPEYSTFATLLLINPSTGLNYTQFAVYLYITNTGKYYYTFGIGTNRIIGWKRILTEDEKIENVDISMLTRQGAFSAFAKFGVVGDSLSVGHMTDPETEEMSPRNIYYSWGQQLARKNGNICLNFGFSGATTKTWFIHANRGFNQLAIEDNKCQAYIIGLGTNDTGEIGSIADIDWNDYNNNLDSFYGNYSKILQAINVFAPKSKIFVFTIPYPRSDVSKNNAIREISQNSQLNNVFLVDLDANYNDLFKSEYITNNYYKSHCTAIGYANCALINEIAISDVMNANGEKFRDVAFIPYGSNNIIE